VINSVVVTTDECRTGGETVAGRAGGRFTLATGRTGGGGGGVTTGGGGGAGGTTFGGGVGRGAGGVGLGGTTAGEARTTGGGVGLFGVGRGLGFGGGVLVGVGLALVGVGVGVGGLGVTGQDPCRTTWKSTSSPSPLVGGPVAVLTSTFTLDPGDPPMETHTSMLVPGRPEPPPESAQAAPAGTANNVPAPTAHPHRRARPHALMATIFRAVDTFGPNTTQIHSDVSGKPISDTGDRAGPAPGQGPSRRVPLGRHAHRRAVRPPDDHPSRGSGARRATAAMPSPGGADPARLAESTEDIQ
jgi:hypothetical protein